MRTRSPEDLKPVGHSGDLQGFLQDLERSLLFSDYEDSSNIAIESGETCWIKDLREHPSPMPIQSAALERNCTSVISTPVVYDGRRRGAFTLYYTIQTDLGSMFQDSLRNFSS